MRTIKEYMMQASNFHSVNEYLSTKKINKDHINNILTGTKIENVSLYYLLLEDFGVNMKEKSAIEYDIKYGHQFNADLYGDCFDRNFNERDYCNLFKKHINEKIDIYVSQESDYVKVSFIIDDLILCYNYTAKNFDYVIDTIKSYVK